MRARLGGFLLVGRHKNGESLDPVEERLLVQLAAAAAAGYDNVAFETLKRENERLREAVLRRDERATPT
jgi:hypothetical protein